jgi:hypothetical protein
MNMMLCPRPAMKESYRGKRRTCSAAPAFACLQPAHLFPVPESTIPLRQRTWPGWGSTAAEERAVAAIVLDHEQPDEEAGRGHRQ